MQMGACGPSGAAYERYFLSFAHALILFGYDITQMSVIGVDPTSVVNEHGVSVAPKFLSAAGEDYPPVSACEDGLPNRCGYVESLVQPSHRYPNGEVRTRRVRETPVRNERVLLSDDGIGHGFLAVSAVNVTAREPLEDPVF